VSEPPGERDLVRQNARLARRIDQLESTLSSAETMRDANARLLDRVMHDLERERARSQDLLRNILPEPIIERLNAGERLIADRYEDVTVLFSDFVDFTRISADMPVGEVVSSLNAMFSAFDAACTRLGVEKIKTIGDAYMAAAGLPGTSDRPVVACAELALSMLDAVAEMGPPWQIRIGIHRGPVIAGVIGTSKYVYDLWGDAVNTASRLETTTSAGTIQVSEAVATSLMAAGAQSDGQPFVLEVHGDVELKGKGPTRTYRLRRGPPRTLPQRGPGSPRDTDAT
jgi:class 3 adenylate cyclase